MGFLLLGIDSLIVCAAVGALVEKRWRLTYAALFGVADGLAFLLGAGLGLNFLSEAASTALQTAIVIGLGLYLLLVVAGTQRGVASRWSVWVFPHLLILDNLTYGLTRNGDLYQQAAQQAVSSALLATAGLLVAAWLPRVVPAARASATRFAGAGLLVAAGALVVVG